MIDTGTGEAALTQTKGATGQFLTNLAAAGIDAKAIDAVIISELLPDAFGPKNLGLENTWPHQRDELRRRVAALQLAPAEAGHDGAKIPKA